MSLSAARHRTEGAEGLQRGVSAAAGGPGHQLAGPGPNLAAALQPGTTAALFSTHPLAPPNTATSCVGGTRGWGEGRKHRCTCIKEAKFPRLCGVLYPSPPQAGLPLLPPPPPVGLARSPPLPGAPPASSAPSLLRGEIQRCTSSQL